MLNALDLFSGIGGNTLALKQWTKTIAYCEADRHAQAVLLSRMSDGSIPRAPICTDVSQLDGNELRGLVDIIIAGFPCQDISCAGDGVGLEGKRSSLFYEILRLAEQIKPTFLFLENVPNIRTKGLDRVVEELTQAGYDCRWVTLSAADIGAPQKRDRWFLLANAQSVLSRGKISDLHCENETLARPKNQHQDPTGQPQSANRNEGILAGKSELATEGSTAGQWKTVPEFCRMVNGVPQRVDRLKRLGNAVVPQQAEEAFKILIGQIK